MAHKRRTPNNEGVLYAVDSATGEAAYVTATNNILDVNATLEVGDIEIGAVEIKDGVSDVRQTVLDLTSSNPATVAIVDGTGAQITSFGGGTQYADGAARGTATGTLMMVDDGTNIQSAAGTAAGILKVDLSGTTANATAVKVDGSAVTQPVSAASLPLPTGAATLAEQQTQTASLSVLDDWDESDRAKVNLIVGQAGIAAGTGVDGVTVPRVSLATNVALPAGANVIGHVIADTGSTTAVTGTVTVSGTVTANAGTNLNTSALALAATQTDKSQFTKLTDGTDTALVTAAGEQNVLESNSAAIKTSVELIDNAISGAGFNITQFAGVNNVTGSGTATGALRVELPTNGTGVIATVTAVTAITNALPAGTNGIGKLTANSGVTIGAVEIAAAQTLATVTTVSTVTNVATIGTSVTPGTAGANLGKAEDAAHTTGEVGVFSLGVRNDTLADVTSTTADYSQLSTDIKGRVMTAGAPRALKGTAQVALSATTSETTIIAATASTFHDVYGIILANTGATTTKVSIRDDTAGTVRGIIEVPTLETRGFMLPVDSAVPQTATNKNWTAQCASATTALEVTAFFVSMV